MNYGYFTKYADKAMDAGNKQLAKRIKTEGKIAAALIDAVLTTEGRTISVFDGEETTVEQSTDKAEIIQAMFTAEEDVLIVRDATQKQLGWFQFIYGNDGYDVIADYSDNAYSNEVWEQICPVIDRAEYDMC